MSAEDLVPTDDPDAAEVGDLRAGRLVEPDEGVREDVEKDLVATDVGIDGGAASAEEAAMHVVEEPRPTEPLPAPRGREVAPRPGRFRA